MGCGDVVYMRVEVELCFGVMLRLDGIVCSGLSLH